MKARYYISLLAYCALIYWLSSQSDPPRPDIDFEGSDKVAHFIVYSIMAAILSIGLHRAPKPHTPWVLRYVPVLFAAAYGVTDELHQLFTPGRHFSFLDMLANTLGAIAGHACCVYYFRRRPNAQEAEGEGTS